MKKRDAAAAEIYRRRSGRFLVVVISQHAAESLAARYFTGGRAHFLASSDQLVAESLVIALRVIEVRNTLPSNTKSVKCIIPGTRSSGTEFMFTESSTSSAEIFVGVAYPGRKAGLVFKYRHGCLIERFVLL